MSEAQGAAAGPPGGSGQGRRRSRTRRPGAPRLTVHVSREIIQQSEERNSGHCMIAEAVKAAVRAAGGEAKHVAVDLQTIRWSDPEKRLRYSYLTPRAAQVALILFDQGKHNEEPFTIFLRNAQVVKMGNPNAPRDLKKVAPMPAGTSVELHAPREGGPRPVPQVVGGKSPPTGPLTNTVYRGKRRAFGLRLLKY